MFLLSMLVDFVIPAQYITQRNNNNNMSTSGLLSSVLLLAMMLQLMSAEQGNVALHVYTVPQGKKRHRPLLIFW